MVIVVVLGAHHSWPTTLKLIKQSYGSLEHYLERHQVDLLCLQEVKTAKRVLQQDGHTVGANLKGFDTFWGYNQQKVWHTLNSNGAVERRCFSLHTWRRRRAVALLWLTKGRKSLCC